MIQNTPRGLSREVNVPVLSQSSRCIRKLSNIVCLPLLTSGQKESLHSLSSMLVRIVHVTVTSSTLVTRLAKYSLQCSHSHKIASCINYVTTRMLHSRMHIKCSSLHSSHMELLSFHNLVIVFLAN